MHPDREATDGIYVGLMSGTSMDAIDTVIVDFTDQKQTVVGYEQYPIDETLRTAVRNINASSSLETVTRLDSILGHAFADAAVKLLQQLDVEAKTVSAIGSHGQTVLHLPDDSHPRTLQLGDPNIIAQTTGITTVADFRRMDMASGGQGAPLAPAYHEHSFRNQAVDRVILNLGGVANISVLPKDLSSSISGFDTGPGNGLLDDWNKAHKQTDMDKDSAWALSGNRHTDLLDAFLKDPFFAMPAPKSTGRDYFNLDWITGYLSQREKLRPEDVQATLLALTVETVAMAVEHVSMHDAELYVCGGGAHNAVLLQRLEQRLPTCRVRTTAALGVDPDAVEAITFAWLAKRTMNSLTGNDPGVTGADRREILGGIYQAYRD